VLPGPGVQPVVVPARDIFATLVAGLPYHMWCGALDLAPQPVVDAFTAYNF